MKANIEPHWSDSLLHVDRRVIYVLIALALSLPLIWKVSLPPAPMRTAGDLYTAVDQLESGSDKLVLISLDWGPSTQAENRPQTSSAMEHLLRRRVPFAVITTYAYAAPFLEAVPQQVIAKLEAEDPSQQYRYGVDWVNLGFQPGGAIMIQGLAKSEDLRETLRTDARGTSLRQIPLFNEIKTIRQIPMLMQFTGLLGTFNIWLQLFQSAEHRPTFIHGCTSITIPEAYIYYASKQIVGLYEGVAGAAWYDHLLTQHYPSRTTGEALRTNTSLAVAHLVIIALVILGNIAGAVSWYQSRRQTS